MHSVLLVDLRMGADELHIGDVPLVMASMHGASTHGGGSTATSATSQVLTFQQFCNFLAPEQLAAGDCFLDLVGLECRCVGGWGTRNRWE